MWGLAVTESREAATGNVDAEMALLGYVMRSGPKSAERFEELRRNLGDESLHAEQSKAIWAALRSLHEQGRAMDKISVEAELRSSGTLADVGGGKTLDEVTARASSSMRDALGHAAIVADAATSRQSVLIAEVLASRARGLVGSALAEHLAEAIDSLQELARNGAGTGEAWTAKRVGDDWQAEWEGELRGDIQALSTGFDVLDYMCKRRGFRQGWLVVLGGRPKMGKTMVALQMALTSMFEPVEGMTPLRYQLKANPTPVFIACDEMRATELYARLMAGVAGLNMGAMGAADPDWAARNKRRIEGARALLDSAPLVFVPDEHSADLERIYVYVRKWRRTHVVRSRDLDGNPVREPALLILDFLQSFQDLRTTKKNAGLPERVGDKVKLAKNESKALGLITILISQLNRKLEDRDDKRPKASDHEGSGKIEQFADIMLGCYREIVYDPNMQTYQDQLKRLRSRVVERAANGAGGSAGVRQALGYLEVAVSGPDGEKRSRAQDLCLLERSEVEEFGIAQRKLSAMEIIVQVNRHGSPGTVYADFQGSRARVLPYRGKGDVA